MSKIKQLLQFHKQGLGKKTIAHNLGISKNTVKAYLDKLLSAQMDIDLLLTLDDPILEAKFHPGNPAYKDQRFEHLKDKLDYHLKELKRPGVTKQLLWEEYIASFPQGYGRTQFCHHLSQHIKASKPSMVLQHEPAEKLYIDFAGKRLSYIDQQTAEVIYCQVFVACLPYSDYSFAMAVESQSVSDFLYALRCCLEAIGGVPKILVPDNLKAAIIKANPYEPDINQALDDFANHYETTVIPTRARKPKDKALVENQVKLIYTRVYAKIRNRQFFDITTLNQAIKEKIKDHNQTRMQQKPYSRQERFLADEKSLLGQLPAQAFQLKYYRSLKVAKNNHVYLTIDKHYYSVPFAYIGAKAQVIYTRSMVYIYVHNNKVAVHIRNYSAGRYSTTKEHLCSSHNHYLDRSPEYYLGKAKVESSELYTLIQLVFSQNRHPEQLYRSCDGLLSLQRKTPPETFKKACLIAIKNQIYSYKSISNIITNKMTDMPQEEEIKPVLPEHNNIRGKAYYSQTLINFKSNDAN